jgi:hypothetical protein
MARDAGLRRISAVTRWTTAAVVALSAGLALIAAKAFHGHTVTSTPSGSTSTPAAQTPASGQSQVAPAAGLQQPTQAPAPAQQVPVVVSGGS